ncbi:hypothetical protein MTBGP_09570 [Moorella thermoacetica]|uniref:replication-relaxation family protein n=1 Tax=Neomoorella thermoacetica TaxID=1525 RepID=UPI0030CB47EB
MMNTERLPGKPYDLFLQGMRQGWTQKRDMDILATLHKFRFVSFSDLVKLYFPSKAGDSAARRRLLKLYRWRLVDRCRQWAPEGPTEYIYMLDDVGAYFLAAYLQKQVEELGWRKRDNQVKLAYVRQYLAAMRLYLELRKQVALVHFEPEYTLKGEGYYFRPDAYAVFIKGKYEYRVFFEVDMGTEGQQKIQEKIKSYEAYYRANARPGFIMPYIIFVADKEERVRKLEAWVEKSRTIKALQYQFWTFGELMRAWTAKGVS